LGQLLHHARSGEGRAAAAGRIDAGRFRQRHRAVRSHPQRHAHLLSQPVAASLLRADARPVRGEESQAGRAAAGGAAARACVLDARRCLYRRRRRVRTRRPDAGRQPAQPLLGRQGHTARRIPCRRCRHRGRGQNSASGGGATPSARSRGERMGFQRALAPRSGRARLGAHRRYRAGRPQQPHAGDGAAHRGALPGRQGQGLRDGVRRSGAAAQGGDRSLSLAARRGSLRRLGPHRPPADPGDFGRGALSAVRGRRLAGTGPGDGCDGAPEALGARRAADDPAPHRAAMGQRDSRALSRPGHREPAPDAARNAPGCGQGFRHIREGTAIRS
jgi:hypothetical protein